MSQAKVQFAHGSNFSETKWYPQTVNVSVQRANVLHSPDTIHCRVLDKRVQFAATIVLQFNNTAQAFHTRIIFWRVFFASRNSLKRQSCQGSTADQEVRLPFVVKEWFPEGFCLAVMDTAEFQLSTPCSKIKFFRIKERLYIS